MALTHCVVDTKCCKHTLIIFKFLLHLHCNNGYMNAPQCYIYTYVIVSCLFLWQRIAGYGSPFIPQVNRSTSKSVHFVISVPNFTNRKWQKCGQMYINKLKMQFVSSRSAKHIKDSIMS